MRNLIFALDTSMEVIEDSTSDIKTFKDFMKFRDLVIVYSSVGIKMGVDKEFLDIINEMTWRAQKK